MQVLYEDNHLIIVNKAPGEIVQGDKTGDRPLSELVADYLREKYHKPGNVFVGVVHRLDRPVSGVVLFAKTSKALSRMNALFRDTHDSVHKVYWTIVQGTGYRSSAMLHHYLRKNEVQNKSYVVRKGTPGAKEATLDYRVLSQGTHYTLLEVKLHTGRHHQIRCQLSAEGMIIRGDLKYGAPRSLPDGSISLHAREIRFEHPVSHLPIHVVAPLPAAQLWHTLADGLE